MNSLVFFHEEREGETRVCLKGDRALYVFQFHGLSPGQSLPVAEWGGKRGVGRVLAVAPDEISLEVRTDVEPMPRLPISVIVGICRPPTMKKIVGAAASMGIAALHFVKAERAEKSYLSSNFLSEDSLKGEILKGLEQAKDSVPPEVRVHHKFDDVFKAELSAPEGRRFIAEPETNFSAPLSIGDGSLCLVIGPEAGWSDNERGKFLASGFKPLSLGPRVLRAETAFTAGAALLLGAASPKPNI